MSRKVLEGKDPDYSNVIRVIEHHLQCGTGAWPYDSHEETARALGDRDAQRALVEIGIALDRVKRSCG